MKQPIFTGANVAIITPMTATGVNYPEFKRIIDDQINRGIDSITICGTTGEGSTLTDKEHKDTTPGPSYARLRRVVFSFQSASHMV